MPNAMHSIEIQQDIHVYIFYLGMSMLASLRGSHLNNLTGTTFQHDMAIFPQSRALHRVRFRGSRFHSLKIIFPICVHCDEEFCHWKKEIHFREYYSTFIPLKFNHIKVVKKRKKKKQFASAEKNWFLLCFTVEYLCQKTHFNSDCSVISAV